MSDIITDSGTASRVHAHTTATSTRACVLDLLSPSNNALPKYCGFKIQKSDSGSALRVNYEI